MSKYSEYENYRFKKRPKKHGSKPRTKIRPKYENALTGRVIKVDRGRYTVILDENQANERTVTAVRAKDLRKQAIVVGDLVSLVGDTSGDEGTLVRLVKIQNRKNVLRRSGDDSDNLERILVANADNLLIVVAAVNPEPRTGLIDRMIVAAFAVGIKPYLCVTKTDLASAHELRNYYEPLGIEVFESQLIDKKIPHEFIENITNEITNKITVLAGHSGVGKSTLVNALTHANRETGAVNEVTGRGRHTTSSSKALKLNTKGWVIDTPGIRSFGLAHVTTTDVLTGFPEILEATTNCEKGCLHDNEAVNCGIDALLTENPATTRLASRVTSLRRLLKNLS
ncbi:MAG: ribosome small subunit-dependent GTPase A [Micrococcaceae bacterium]